MAFINITRRLRKAVSRTWVFVLVQHVWAEGKMFHMIMDLTTHQLKKLVCGKKSKIDMISLVECLEDSTRTERE